MQSNKSKPGAAGKLGVHVNPAALGRAIWRVTVLQAKKPETKEQRQAQWQADREEYLELGRKVVKEIRVMRREQQAVAGKKE